MGNINKGTIASISGNTARVVPSDAGAKPTAKITIPWHLRGSTGNLSKGTAVVYVEFDDSTGLLLGRADGEWGCYLPSLSAGNINVPKGDVTARGISSKQVVALEGLAFSYEQVADENTSTEDKKTTNERGTELFPLSFTTVLHSGAGVDVWAEIQNWKALVTKVNYFYLGGKKLGPKLQLRKVAVSNTKVDGKGRLLLATLSFTFKEYDPATTSVKVSTTALNVKASTASKSANTAAKKAAKKTIKVGDYVKPTGSRYATGQKIPNWVKQRKHRVSQIKSSQNKVLLGHPNGINSWVYLSEVTLA